MSWISKLNDAVAELNRRQADPWQAAIKRALPCGVTSISTVAICDLMDLVPTSANARRIAPCMRALGFVPLKSRRLEPGGRYGTVIRGWARPLRETKLPCPHRKFIRRHCRS